MEPYTLSYLPAAATLAQETQKTSAPNSMLAIAPENTGLQYALEEARLITQLYQPGSRLLSGDEATESAFKQQARDYRVLHFSTHGYFNMRNPLFSGLELAADGNNDGRLEVHEILGLSLNAVLVTLSACESGMGSGYFNELPAGDEFIGLARAFLLAGSHSVLATLWPVDDRSTVAIMEGFYKRMEQAGRTDGHNNNQAVALAQVQRDLKNSSRYKHPFYWAPFVLIGQQDRGAGARI
jgi:CHAT domain-containing protein